MTNDAFFRGFFAALRHLGVQIVDTQRGEDRYRKFKVVAELVAEKRPEWPLFIPSPISGAFKDFDQALICQANRNNPTEVYLMSQEAASEAIRSYSMSERAMFYVLAHAYCDTEPKTPTLSLTCPNSLPLADVCVAAGVDPNRFKGGITKENMPDFIKIANEVFKRQMAAIPATDATANAELRDGVTYYGRLVPVTFPAKRCCAPGCGDKIKSPKWMIEVYGYYSPEEHGYLEESCREWFENGHPDHGGGKKILQVVREMSSPGERRVESGALRINNDWPGLFLRGDDAFGLIQNINALEAYYTKDTNTKPLEVMLAIQALFDIRSTIQKDVVAKQQFKYPSDIFQGSP